MVNYVHLRRLERIWVRDPIFFITTCTKNRRTILHQENVASILTQELRNAPIRHGWHVGHFVVMPDHIHFFCTASHDAKSLSDFMKYWKQWTSKRIRRECDIEGTIWHRQFFDHVIRNNNSYAQKKEYVINNPVRAGLVKHPNEWMWQGELEQL